MTQENDRRNARIEQASWRLWGKLRGCKATLLDSERHCQLIKSAILQQIQTEADRVNAEKARAKQAGVQLREARKQLKQTQVALADLLLASFRAADCITVMTNPQALVRQIHDAQQRSRKTKRKKSTAKRRRATAKTTKKGN